jgi:hypothetical protein
MSQTPIPPQPPNGRRTVSPIFKLLIGVAVLILLALAFFIPVENWRGKRAWQKCKRELEAKGEAVDWNAYIPPPVPDDKNIFKAPHMAEWFVGRGTNELARRLDVAGFYSFVSRRYTNAIVEVTLLPLKGPVPENADVVLQYDPPILSMAGSSDRSMLPSSVIPLVVMEDVPLRDAIRNLAMQAGLKYEFTPDVKFGQPDRPEPIVTGRWEQVTARQVMFTILNQHQLRWIDDPRTNVAQIVADPSGVPRVYADANVREQIRNLLRKSFPTATNISSGSSLNGPQGFSLTTDPLRHVSWTRMVVQATKTPTASDVAGFFSDTDLKPGGVQVGTTGSGFRVLLSLPQYRVGDYLEWSDQFASDFEAMRKAFQRPYGRMEGNYEMPSTVPNPNYIAVRQVAYTLTQRAQCYLLMGEPEKALRELTLMHDLCRMLEAKPTGRPHSLVALMTRTGVLGLYANVVADGLRLRAWREPELEAVQNQLKEVRLLPALADALQAERAGACHIIDMTRTGRLKNSYGTTNTNLWTEWMSLQKPGVPSGWFYQNEVTVAELEQEMINAIDVTNNLIVVGQIDRFTVAVRGIVDKGVRPYTLLAAIIVPNFTGAFQPLALVQTRTDQAEIACALQRYHMAHGSYPENLSALVPQIIEKIPNDVLTGRPLIYRRTDDGRFVVYSVGWNEIDDHGVTRLNPDGSGDKLHGDWTWPTQ